MESLIHVSHLKKEYVGKKYRTLALDDVSFDIKSNEFVSIVGRSGCGKSTLLKIISGLLPKSEGSVKVEGEEVEDPPRKIGFCFQNPALLPWRSTLANILFPVEILCKSEGLDREKCQKNAEALMELAGLKGFEKSYPYELSGGMQSRVAICRALIHDPSILLMDEPFGALDAMTRDTMAFELQRIWQQMQKTVMFVTHSVAEAIFLSDRVLVLTPRPGRVKEFVDISLPRPRTIETKSSPEYGKYLLHLERAIGIE